MFCQRKDDDESTLSCSTKLLSEIISFLSIIFSGMIIYVTAKYTKLNIVNHLILQILISEIIDGINILLVIFEDIQWPFNYENFFNRRGICFTQIFLGLFTCLWTIISSFFISFRIFDITVKNNVIFKKKVMKNVHYFVFFFSFFISFWFWVGQTTYQANQMMENEGKEYIPRPHHHFRHMYCWYETSTNYIIFVIVLILIGGSLFFSIKGIIVLKNIKNKLTEEIEFNDSNFLNKKRSDVSQIINTLWLYPVISGVLWIFYFILQILFNNHPGNGALSAFYVIIISTRQPIYSIVFLITQKNIKKEFINLVTLKTCKKKKNKSIIIPFARDINSEKTNLNNEEAIN